MTFILMILDIDHALYHCSPKQQHVGAVSVSNFDPNEGCLLLKSVNDESSLSSFYVFNKPFLSYTS